MCVSKVSPQYGQRTRLITSIVCDRCSHWAPRFKLFRPTSRLQARGRVEARDPGRGRRRKMVIIALPAMSRHLSRMLKNTLLRCETAEVRQTPFCVFERNTPTKEYFERLANYRSGRSSPANKDRQNDVGRRRRSHGDPTGASAPGAVCPWAIGTTAPRVSYPVRYRPHETGCGDRPAQVAVNASCRSLPTDTQPSARCPEL